MKTTPPAAAVYRVSDFARILGLDRKGPRRVEGWIEKGFIKPAVLGKGPGRSRRFGFEHLLQGALLLEVQAAFGEKSPLVGRLFPDVAPVVAAYWKTGDLLGNVFANRFKTAEEDRLLMVTQEAGKVTDVKRVNAGDLVVPRGASAVTLFNISAIHRSLLERLSQ